jgi:hypothetical protein
MDNDQMAVFGTDGVLTSNRKGRNYHTRKTMSEFRRKEGAQESDNNSPWYQRLN